MLLSAFVVPTSILDRLFQTNVWWTYVFEGFYFYGGLLLIGLILSEYASLAFSFRPRSPFLMSAASRA